MERDLCKPNYKLKQNIDLNFDLILKNVQKLQDEHKVFSLLECKKILSNYGCPYGYIIPDALKNIGVIQGNQWTGFRFYNILLKEEFYESLLDVAEKRSVITLRAKRKLKERKKLQNPDYNKNEYSKKLERNAVSLLKKLGYVIYKPL